jgi:hypothetical protein
MSDNEMKEGVYTTRVTGEMVDDLDEYIDNRGQSKSAAIRHLLDLGLQAEESGVEPAELQKKIDELTEEREELQGRIEELLYQKLAGGLVTMGILLALVGAGLPSLAVGPVTAVLPQAVGAVQFTAAVLITAGLIGWSWVLAQPFVRRVYQRGEARG